MQIKPHYETYRYNALLCKAESQSIVECRFAGNEISTVLSVHAHIVPTEWSCDNGEVRYSGKLVVTAVYEDADKKVCRAERGAEFSHRAQHDLLTPSSFVVPSITADNVSVRREGSGVYVTVVVGARFSAYAQSTADCLYDGDGLVVKKEEQSLVNAVCASSTIEAEDEFETEYALDALMHSEQVYLSEVRAGDKQITVTGEVALNLCALKEDGGLCSYERLVPFHAEVPCEKSVLGLASEGNVRVKSANFSLTADEEKGKCKIEASLVLVADCTVYEREKIIVCADAYSTEREVVASSALLTARLPVESACFTERISGTASLSEPIDYSIALQSALRPRVEISCEGQVAQGAVFADLVLCDKDGAHKSARLSLPFMFPITGDKETKIEGVVCGLGVRQRREGSAEAEATLKVKVTRYETNEARYLCKIEEGAEFERNDFAVSVYLPCAGDGLWETAKRLKRTPEELVKSNPELKFPLCGTERIFVYRQKN